MNSSYEDVFIYLDLTKEILKKKDIIKTIRHYITEKNKVNLKGHYGLLIFQEEGNPVFITNKKDSNIIINAIEENWKSRPKNQSFFENGLFYVFSYLTEKIRKKSKTYRIIIITDTPSDLSEDYTDVLFNLVSIIKNFPTYIDIIRISLGESRFFKDDVKLNVLASDTKGSIFYVNDKKDFFKTMDKLIKMKQLVSIFADKPAKISIKKEDYNFYSRLAKRLIPAPQDNPGIKCQFCEDEVCPVCADVNDIPLMCPDCRTTFHKCCVTNYTIGHNIGIPHIFRCPKCDVLLQIDQDEIVQPENPEIESVEEYIDNLETDYEEEDYLEAEDAYEEMDNEVDKIEEMEAESRNILQEDQAFGTPTADKIIHIGGFFGKMYKVRKEGDNLVYERVAGINRNSSS
ncbi:MAG: hypothetical protein MUP85_03780, partial [Candidatus Lokiarchaeota archaeon]|nr:hypothetical protein [Candidatus Lokiarchaeota archaeon]